MYESEADILVKEAKQLYFKRKYQDAVTKCKLAVDMDNGEAYFMLGLLVARGHRCRDAKDAMSLYKKGREKNNAAAINAIGVMYYRGDHVPQDIEEAISCFREADDLGDMFAPYNLARCYELGIGVSQDREKAQESIFRAICRGNDHAGDYFERKLINAGTNEIEAEPEDEVDSYGFVFSKEHWGYLEKTVKMGNVTITILDPLYSEDYYKKNADVIKRYEESYRRECMYKLPELIIM